jgi:hypothetical protein
MHHMSLPGLRGANRSLPSKWLILNAVLVAICGIVSQAFAQVMQADGTGANGGGVVPSSYTSSGSYFNRELGTPLRFKYHSEGYGTETGVVSLGTMQVFNLDGAAWFLDGQGTMSEDFGGGFNAGIGYRELASLRSGFDAERILGGSFWVDGQSTKADNFFSQLSFGLESLGESFDLRMNGYFPLDRTKTSDPTLIDFDTITFAQNGLFSGLARTTTDTAYSVLDAEFAKRIHDLDAWAVAAVYQLGGETEDETGWRVGLRGYAVPDLLVGVEYTEDDIYDRQVMASLTWFVGRTHSGNAPIGQIVDRFREPVMRNDFIATTSAFTDSGATQLTDADTDAFFDFIHVDSNEAVNGDGTFENPFNNLASAQARQADGSYVFIHSDSEFNNVTEFPLLDNVKFWGEGTNPVSGDVLVHVVDTVERGSVTLPETATGAQDLDMYVANILAGQNFLIAADNNDVRGGTINGGVNAFTANAINAPQLSNMNINDSTGTGISLTNITGTTVIDNTVIITNANNGMLIHGGLGGMDINARIVNSDANSLTIEDRTGGTIAFGGSILDTDGTVDINDDAVVDAADADVDNADAIVIQRNVSSTINFSQTLDLGDDLLGINVNSGDNRSLFIDENQQTTTITFADLRATSAGTANTIEMQDGGTLVINDSDDDSLIANTGTGDAFNNVGDAMADFNSIITIAANIENSGGGNAVDISGRDADNVTFNGTITDTGATTEAILLTGNSGGTIAFNEQVTINSVGAGFGVRISGGSDTIVYNFTDIDITTVDGTGFSMLDGGTLTVNPSTGEENTITTTTGQALVLDSDPPGDPLTIGTAGVTFDTINVSAGTTDSVVLRDIDGGQVTLGSGANAPDGGTINTTASAIIIDNAADVVVNNIDINKTGAGDAVQILNQEEDSTVDFDGVDISATGTGNGLVIGSRTVAADGNEVDSTATFTDLIVNTVDGNAVTVQNNTGGTFIFNDLDAGTSGAGDAVHIEDNTVETIVTFNGMDLDATGTGDAFSSENAVELAATGDTSVTAVDGRGVAITGATIGAAGAQFDTVNVTSADTNGVLIQNTIGTGAVTIGSAPTGGTIVSAGEAIVIDNADNVVVTQMTIANNVAANNGNGLVIRNQDGGTVSVTGLTSRTQNGTAVLIEDNTGGSNVFSTTIADADGTGNGVVLDTNTGSTTTFNGATITTTSGTGFEATGGGTVSVTGTSTVATTTGTGVNMNGMTIGAGGVNFNTVNVNGAVNGVVLTDLSGGQFRQGAAAATGVDGTGGTLTTTGDAIVLNGVTNAVFNDVTANSSAGRAVFVSHTITTQATIVFDNLATDTVALSGDGVVLEDNGNGELDFTLRNSTVNTVDSDTNAFLFTTGNNSGDVDIRLQGNTELRTDNEIAVSAVVNSGTGNIQFLMTGNTIVNNSAAGGSAQFDLSNSRTLNLTVGGQGGPGNDFENSNAAGIGFVAQTLLGSSGRINLDLRNNTSNAGSANDYQLTNVATADFGVVDRDDTFNDANNTGNVNGTGTFLDIPSVPQVD